MKILAFVGAHSLAHVTRPLEIARCMSGSGHTTVFAGRGPYAGVVRDSGYAIHDVPYIDTDLAVSMVKQGRYGEMYPLASLQDSFDAEVGIIRQERPDVVVVDDRCTVATSAYVCGVPCVSITNAHMSAHRVIPFGGVTLGRLSRGSGILGVVNRALNYVEQQFWDRVVLRSLRGLRRQLGVPRLHGYAMSAGDLCLYSDIPEFNPARYSACSHYVGPLTWRNGLDAAALADMISDGRRNVYLSIGSSGLDVILDNLGRFRDTGFRFVVVSGRCGDAVPKFVSDDVLLTPMVNADAILPLCQAIVCHGGNGTIYQSLRHGLPILGYHCHAEQAYGLQRCRDLNVGIGFPESAIREGGIGHIVHHVGAVLADAGMVEAARGFAQKVRRWDSAPERASSLIGSLVQRERSAPAAA